MADPVGQEGSRSRPSPSEQHASNPEQPARGRITLVVATSILAGLIVAVVLVAAPILPVQESSLTGAVLLGFAAGWALLAVLSQRFTDRPQSWAAVPAAFMAVAGVVCIAAPATVRAAFGWIWPLALLGLVIWMVGRIRRQLDSRAARALVYPIVAVLAVAAIGGGYEAVRESLDARAYPPPGRLVDVGGHRLHLHCSGSGSPTVVLEPGLGASSSDLGWIEPAVAQDTKVCVYDRAGRGWSDPVTGPQDADQIAKDLHTLLTNAGVDGPYVLAGHSFGGLYVLDFAAQFPDQVAGLVLLDSTASKPGSATQAAASSGPLLNRAVALAPALSHLGIGRVLAHLSYGSYPPRTQAEARANASTSNHMASVLQEYVEGAASVRQASGLSNFGDKPLVVLTADTGHDEVWRSAQDRLAALSTNAVHRLAEDTTHTSMLDDRADSAAASQAIRDVVAAVRSGQPLTR